MKTRFRMSTATNSTIEIDGEIAEIPTIEILDSDGNVIGTETSPLAKYIWGKGLAVKEACNKAFPGKSVKLTITD